MRVPGRLRRQSQQLRAGPADQLARLRRARDVRRARRAALPGLHSRRRCPTARARPAASACSPRGASKCCAARSRRSTATRPGGVISVFTEDPAPTPVVDVHAAASAATRRTTPASRRPAPRAAVGYVVAANHFDTDGYREHSAAPRDVVNAKLVFAPADADARDGDRQLAASTRFAGSARADAGAGRRRSAPGRSRRASCSTRARRSTSCRAALRSSRSSRRNTTLRVTGYGGTRQIGQYLALTGVGATSSGGVVNLDRNYGGIGARFICAASWSGAPVGVLGRRRRRPHARAAAGLRQQQRRAGRAAARRGRHRRAAATSTPKLEWHALPRAVAHARRAHEPRALRLGRSLHRRRRTRTTAARAPTTTRARSPASSGMRADDLNVYASYGQGFETPTFAELAYRPVGRGPQSRARPRDVDVGRGRAQVAAHRRGSASTSRSSPPTPTRRSSSTPRPAAARRTATRARRAAADSRRRGTPISAPASPRTPTTRSSRPSSPTLRHRPAAGRGARGRAPAGRAAATGVRRARLDAGRLLRLQRGGGGAVRRAASTSTTATPRTRRRIRSATRASASRRPRGNAQLREYVRVNNIANVNYIGSVIVGDTNGRYFEPAPGRNWFAGVSVNVAF